MGTLGQHPCWPRFLAALPTTEPAKVVVKKHRVVLLLGASVHIYNVLSLLFSGELTKERILLYFHQPCFISLSANNLRKAFCRTTKLGSCSRVSVRDLGQHGCWPRVPMDGFTTCLEQIHGYKNRFAGTIISNASH